MIEVNPGSWLGGTHLLRLVGEATVSHRVTRSDAVSTGAHAVAGVASSLPLLCLLCVCSLVGMIISHIELWSKQMHAS